MRFINAVSASLALGLFVSAGVSFAQSYPDKPIRFLIPFGPGSSTDIIGRVVGQKLSQSFGQPIIVDNRPGANGTIGTVLAANAAPDGYTILVGSGSTHGTNVSMFSKLPYDPVKDFAPISQLYSVFYVLVVGANHPVNSVKELVALAKANPGKRTLANTAGISYLTGELFKLATGIDMIAVPYKTAAPAFVDLISGQTDALFQSPPSAWPQVRAGRLKALGITSLKHSVLTPGVPTISESGFPGFENTTWIALFAPAGTPKAIIDKVHTGVTGVLKNPDVREKLLQNGVGESEIIGGTPAQLKDIVNAEIAKWIRVTKEARIPKVN